MKKTYKVNPNIIVSFPTIDDNDKVNYVKIGDKIVILVKCELIHTEFGVDNIHVYQYDPKDLISAELCFEIVNVGINNGCFLIEIRWDRNGPIAPSNQLLITIDGGLVAKNTVSVPIIKPTAEMLQFINTETEGYVYHNE